ncbi:hypothetical protein [Alicyclobacillus fastidiosus]|uniref:PE-PGRS family protein n=1 Tax=Alicyclobacillus fastidiosus TaxID=392011 RepID=A0ABV5AKI5_9BACL|nr:hypothetical protein [Alicyclobacillus fastidiosus]WEH08174.1 hypothetical protein PYS47_15825 [Alicyclobacillus fastidiosus]
MDVSRILADHGFGGSGLVPFFGDGSDGEFNPTGSPTTNTYTLETSTGNYSASTGTSNYTYGVQFEVQGEPITVTEILVCMTEVSSSAILYGYIWDSDGNVIATASITGVAGNVAWNTIGISPTTLQPGTYMLGWASATSLNIPRSLAASDVNLTYSTPEPMQSTVILNISGETYYHSGLGGYPTATFGSTPGIMGLTFQTTQYQQYTFQSSEDGDPVIKQFTDINIPSGVAVTVSNRCKGLIMLCQGDVTIDGAIVMDDLGPWIDPIGDTGIAIPNVVKKLNTIYEGNVVISIGTGGAGGDGGDGGYGGTTAVYKGGSGGSGLPGSWWGGGRGGGGGGGASSSSVGGNGGDASWSGTSTGGSPVSSANGPGVAGTNGGGGSGGNGSGTSGAGGTTTGGSGAGGGGGNYSSNGINGSSVSSGGVGGLIVIIAKGSITIGSSATLSARATTPGGSGGYGVGNYSGGGGGGGGAGGGIIALLHKGAFSNSGSLYVDGAPGGMGGYNTTSSVNGINPYSGSDGAPGTIQIQQLA